MTTLDSNTAIKNADNIRALREPERVRKQLAEARADILDEVREFLDKAHIYGPIDNLLSFVTFNMNLFASIEQERNEKGGKSRVYDYLPTFHALSEWMNQLSEIIRLIVKIGVKQDEINTLQEALILQSEPEGHTIVR